MFNNSKRQIVLDTETTGMNKFSTYYEGHRIIEIGAIEIINRKITGNYFHTYIKPNRNIDLGAFNVHGISNEFLIDKPLFSDVVNKFINFIYNSELIMHNARFDIGFINNEFNLLKKNISKIETFCKIIDTLKLARKMFPGKRNSLNALCDRYFINRNQRTFHGALVDAKILAKIFLLMTGGQTSICFDKKKNIDKYNIKLNVEFKKKINNCLIKIIYANKNEINFHKKILELIFKKSGICLWNSFNNTN